MALWLCVPVASVAASAGSIQLGWDSLSRAVNRASSEKGLSWLFHQINVIRLTSGHLSVASVLLQVRGISEDEYSQGP